MKKRVLVALLCASVGVSSQVGMPMVEAASVEQEQVMESTDWNALSEETTGVQSYKASDMVKGAQGGTTITLKVSGGGDISTALNNALKECKKNGTVGATIKIPSGNYKLKQPIRLISNVKIAAAGATITVSSNMDYMITTGAQESIKNTTIEGGTWDAARKVKNGFVFYKADNITIKSCTIKNVKEHGMRIGQKSKIAAIEGCSISNNSKSGIYVDDSAVISNISKSTISTNGDTGITVSGAEVKKITNSDFVSNTAHGIAVYKSAKVRSISGGKMKSNKEYGIYVQKKSSVTIQGRAQVQNNKENGIVVSDSKSKATIDNVVCAGNGGSGIVFSKGSSGSIKNTTVTGSKEHGITISGSSVNMECSSQTKGNKVERNNWNGVSISGKSSKVKIKYGVFSNNGLKPKKSSEGESGHGVGVFQGASLELNKARTEGNTVCGVSPFGKGTSATIKGCVIQNNGRHGIGGRESVTLRIKGNTINNNKQHGIMVNDKCNAKYIENNTIQKNKKCGICVGDNSQAVIKKNDISDSGQNGIYVYNKSKATIEGDKIQTSKECGIVTFENADITVKGAVISRCNEYGMNIKSGKANIQSCTIKDNKSSGIQIKDGANVSSLSKNKINKNGQYGIYSNGATVKKMEKNTIINHKKYGIVLYSNSTCNGIKNNTLSNPEATKEISIQSSRSNVGDANVITVKSAKKNSKKITGTATPKSKVEVKIDGKDYSTNAKSSGSYTIKTSKLAVGTKLRVQSTVDGGNKVYVDHVVM